MKIQFIEALFWSIFFLIFSLGLHFLHKYLFKKNLIEKKNIEELKKLNLEKSYGLRENWNQYMNTYIGFIKISKWIIILSGIYIFLRAIWDNW